MHPALGDLAYNTGMCPNWESNQQLFGLQASTQTTELYQPGLSVSFYHYVIHYASVKIKDFFLI